jgi:hypothetical protein
MHKLPIRSVLYCFVFFVLISPALTVEARGQGKRRIALTPGMGIDDALRVALDCVKEAAVLRVVGVEEPRKLYRLDDKLGFLGVNDSARLNALRRYIIRNEEIGVQSVWWKWEAEEGIYRFRRYLLSRADLSDLKSDWTLLKLAQRISDKAGIAQLPPSSAKQIIADCIAYPDDRSPDESVPAAYIAVDAPLGAVVKDPDKFAKCVVASRRYGIGSVKLRSPDDDSTEYVFAVGTPGSIARYIADAVKGGWNSACVTNFLIGNTQAAFPAEGLAVGAAMSAILQFAGGKKFTNRTELADLIDARSLPLLRQQIRFSLDPGRFTVPPGCTAPASGPPGLKRLAVITERRGGARPEIGPGNLALLDPAAIGGLEEITMKTTVEGVIQIVLQRIQTIQ